MPEVLIIPGERNYHSVLQYLWESTGSLFDEFERDIRLWKIVRRIVYYRWYGKIDIHAQIITEHCVTILENGLGESRQFVASLIEIDIEMLGFEDTEVEVFILDLILTEVLRKDDQTQHH